MERLESPAVNLKKRLRPKDQANPMATEQGPARPTIVAGAKGTRDERETQERLAAQRAEFQRVVDRANATIGDLRTFIRDMEERLKRAEEAVQVERRAREAAEGELENLKRGSQNMIRYVSSLQRKKHDEEIRFMQEMLDSLQKQVEHAKSLALPAHNWSAEPRREGRARGGNRGRRRKQQGRR